MLPFYQMTQDKFILSVGAQVGGCLVDGLGDGVMVQAPGLERGMLRSVCFGLLQVKQSSFGECRANYSLLLHFVSKGSLSPGVSPRCLVVHQTQR